MPLPQTQKRAARSPLRSRSLSPASAGTSPSGSSASIISPQSRPTTPAHVGTALLLLATCLRTSLDPCSVPLDGTTSGDEGTHGHQQVPPFQTGGFGGHANGGARGGMFGTDGFINDHISSAYSLLQEVSSSSSTTPVAARRGRGGSRASGSSIGDVGTAADNAEDTPKSQRTYAAYGDSSASSDDVFAMLGNSEDDEKTIDDDSDERKRLNHKRRQTKSSSSAVSIESCDVVPSAPGTSALSSLSSTDRASVLAAAMQFMPLEAVEVLRAVSADFEAAASRVAAKPFIDAQDVAFVRWTPQTLRTVPLDTSTQARRNKKMMAAAAMASPTVPYQWRCLACESLNNGNKACACCGTQTNVGACRVFLGQLRKELTAELATAMTATVCPSVKVLHMESHTNGTGTRGKGCAWAYLDSVEDARAMITALHKRAFVDVDADGGEGFWYVLDSEGVESRKANLAAFAQERAAATIAIEGSSSFASASASASAFADGHRSAATMPRQPVVAEAGAESLLAFALAQ